MRRPLVILLLLLLTAACSAPEREDGEIQQRLDRALADLDRVTQERDAARAAAGLATPSAEPAGESAGTVVLLADRAPGAKTTRRFTVASSAIVEYSYDCGASSVGIFQIYSNKDGRDDTILANSGAPRAAASTNIPEPGEYYFQVNSTCPWEMTVRG